ncbi:hypothetical protein ACI2KT_33385, partial [Ensifer adhaerens]|uniref:hypothetical protein n=1 Tax=Ensifer adhaerens TaxID=106592 RepID=UPI00384FC632
FAESARLHQNLLDHKARENSTFEVRYSAGGLPNHGKTPRSQCRIQTSGIQVVRSGIPPA